jgi:hypothetical protein
LIAGEIATVTTRQEDRSERRLCRAGDWLSATIGDEMVMMSAETGLYLGLSGTGSRIWELLEAPLSLDMLCEKLSVEYDVVPDQAKHDVAEFIDELVRHGALIAQ